MNIKAKIVAIIVNILSKINLLSIAIGFINAGIAITNNILNILDPIILPRAISPSFLHEAIIDVIEVLGKEKTLYVKLKSGKDLVITVPGYHQYEVGEKHNFGFDLGALHFFDAETELRIN